MLHIKNQSLLNYYCYFATGNFGEFHHRSHLLPRKLVPLSGFLVLLIKEFKNRLCRHLKDHFMRVQKENDRVATYKSQSLARGGSWRRGRETAVPFVAAMLKKQGRGGP